MSEFSTSPRPRIVNGVLVREFNSNRCNGLQGTNSKEDLYRAIAEMPSPVPEPDTGFAESVNAERDLHGNFSPRENCPHCENVSRSVHFAREPRNITGRSETCSVHCDHKQAFEPRECEQQTPSCCTHSNTHHYSTATKRNMGQDRLNSDVCCEGGHLTPRNEWESGDHNRSMADGSPTHNEEGYHHTPDKPCCNVPILFNKNQPKYPCEEHSPQNTGRGSTVEECQDNHYHTCPHTQDAVLTEGKPTPRTPRLHEQAIDSSHGNTENCNALMESEHEHLCNPQNAICKSLSRENNRTMQYDKSEALMHPQTTAPACLHTTTQECRPQDEQPEYNQATPREEFNYTEGQFEEEFAGYPPQRRVNPKQYNKPNEDENASHHGNKNTASLRSKKNECRRFVRRRSLTGNVTEREARSVAEILNHPVVDVDSERCNPPFSPPLRTLSSEDVMGYPPQPITRKSKHPVHRACEQNPQNEQTHCNYSTQNRQVTGRYDCSKLNDSWTHAEGEHERRYVDQRSNVKCGNEYEGYDEYCRGCNKTSFHHPHRNENEREETFPHGSAQDTVCVNQEQYERNMCMEHSPRTLHPEAQEQYYQSHHSSNTPDEETKNFSAKKRPQESKSHTPVSCERHESRFQHRDEILNDIDSRRKNKELYGGSTTNSCRPVSECYEDEIPRNEKKNLVRVPEGQCNENPTSSSVKHSDGCKHVSGEDDHCHHNIASHDELQAGERDKCSAQSTNVPTRSYNRCEPEHTRDNPHPRVSEPNSKTTEHLGECSEGPCEISKHDDNIVPCQTDRLCNPGGDSSGLNEQCIKKPYRRFNGLEDEDNERVNAVEIDVPLEENNEVDPKKLPMPILQPARKNPISQNKREPPAKFTLAQSMPGPRIHPSSLLSKTRIPKLKSNANLASQKGNTAAQRPKRTTTLKS